MSILRIALNERMERWMARIHLDLKQISEGEDDICNIPGIGTVVEVQYCQSLALPEKIIQFKITMNEAKVCFCYGKRSKKRGEVVIFGLNSRFMLRQIVVSLSEMIAQFRAWRYAGMLIPMKRGMKFAQRCSPLLKLSRTQFFNIKLRTL